LYEGPTSFLATAWHDMQAFFCAKSVLAQAGVATTAAVKTKTFHPRIFRPFKSNISNL
jgi:hypothetical protein